MHKVSCFLVPMIAASIAGREIVAQTGWVEVTAASGPSAREGHQMAFDFNRGRVVLFGGSDATGLRNDTWEWDGTQWAQRFPAHSPSPRVDHSIAYDFLSGNTVVFGGTTPGLSQLDDTWTWDGIDWTQQSPSHAPSARARFRMAFDHTIGRILGFGGAGPSASGYSTFGDSWEWDGSDWRLRSAVSPVGIRWGCGLASDGFRRGLVLFGGSLFSGTVVSQLSAITVRGEWAVARVAVPPPPMAEAYLAGDPVRCVAVLFGGQPNSSYPLADQTWVFAGSTWIHDPRAGPPGRYRTALACDFARGRVVMFGGRRVGGASELLGDTWEYTVDDEASWRPIGAACPGRSALPGLAPRGASRPILGSTFELQLSHQVTNGPGWVALGLSDRTWASFTLPLELSPFGMPRCMLGTSTECMEPVSLVGGTARVSFPIPLSTGLSGLDFFNQGFVVVPEANAAGLVVSNPGAGRIGSN